MKTVPQSKLRLMAGVGSAGDYGKNPMPKNASSPAPQIIGSSFNRMTSGGQGGSGGFIGSMGGLEAASMRLGTAATEREKGLIAARGQQERETITLQDWLEDQKRKKLEKESRKSALRDESARRAAAWNASRGLA